MGLLQTGQHALPCYLMRGGSSRGGFFLAQDLPSEPLDRAAWLLAAYGSPDLRQIDGIGGADALTSKAAVIARSAHPGADVDYTFCQIGIDRPQVATGGNCGNMLSAVGPFAIYRGLVQPTPGVTVVRIYTTNTRQVVTAQIPMDGELPAVEGDCRIAGVPSAGARIMLDFGDCSGAVTGQLLPTGRVRDRITIDGIDMDVSLVDAATPFVFVKAADLGAKGTELPAEIAANLALMARLEAVRGWAAQAIGRVDDARDAVAKSPNVPRVIMVSAPADYTSVDGRRVGAGEADLVVRQLAMQKPHKALAVVGSVCTAVASALQGSVAAECRAAGRAGYTRLGHPSGVLQVEADVEPRGDGGYAIRGAKIERTARLILSGDLHLSARRIAELRAVVTL
ncbi:MAG: methylitaconate delta2-delta3-isomerase [Burkholderiales bacterium]|nr:methylitaconate delta2-delta3-isomerase [Burkholderiales bacterium]